MTSFRRTLKWMTGLALASLVLAAGAECLLRNLLPETCFVIPTDRLLRPVYAERHRRHSNSMGSTNVFRIGLIGDSVTAGAGVHRYDRVGDRLEWLLNLNGDVPPVEVETFARPSATYQQSGQLNRAIDWGARLIIFVIHLNDTEDWSLPVAMLQLRRQMDERPPPKWLQPLTRRSVLARLIYARLEERRMALAVQRFYNYLYGDDYSGMGLFRSAISNYHARCAATNVAMATVLMPITHLDTRAHKYPLERHHAIVRSICETEKLPFLDLIEAYRRTTPARTLNIVGVDDHPSEIGHRIAADAIFAFLLDQHLADAAYAPRKLSDPAFINRIERKLRATDIPFTPARRLH